MGVYHGLPGNRLEINKGCYSCIYLLGHSSISIHISHDGLAGGSLSSKSNLSCECTYTIKKLDMNNNQEYHCTSSSIGTIASEAGRKASWLTILTETKALRS